MEFTRQFKAMARVATIFSGAWAALGSVVAVVKWLTGQDGGLLGQVATHLIMYGAAGAICGMVTAVILARAEAGRQVEQLATRRMAVWGTIGGGAPAALFGLLALVFGAPADTWVSLLGVGIVSGGIGAAVATSISMAAKRGRLSATDATPRLPAT